MSPFPSETAGRSRPRGAPTVGASTHPPEPSGPRRAPGREGKSPAELPPPGKTPPPSRGWRWGKGLSRGDRGGEERLPVPGDGGGGWSGSGLVWEASGSCSSRQPCGFPGAAFRPKTAGKRGGRRASPAPGSCRTPLPAAGRYTGTVPRGWDWGGGRKGGSSNGGGGGGRRKECTTFIKNLLISLFLMAHKPG